MKLAIRGIGLVIVVLTLAQWQAALQAEYGELDVVGGLALPVAWGITGYGLLRLREWGRQLMLLVCAVTILRAVIVIVIDRHIGAEAFGMLLIGVNVAFLLMRRSAISVIRHAPPDSTREPQIEGWLAGSAALILFGAVWYAVLLPITGAIWNWYWGLSTLTKAILFVVAGTYFVGLVWFTLVVPFSVAGHFFDVAVRAGGESDTVRVTALEGKATDFRSSQESTIGESLEILPVLKAKYPHYLRPEITSVRFGQSRDRCYLEIHTAETVGGYLRNEAMKRDDLGFVSSGVADDRPFFDPSRPIRENARRFLEDFDETSIMNCTDLFEPDAAALMGRG